MHSLIKYNITVHLWMGLGMISDTAAPFIIECKLMVQRCETSSTAVSSHNLDGADMLCNIQPGWCRYAM